LKVAIPAGQGPDIIGWTNDQIGTQAIAGNIVPIDPYGVTPDFLTATYAPSAANGVQYQGKIWALPESVEAIALVYNKALVTAKYLPKDRNDFTGLLAAATAFQTDNPGKTLICNQGFPGGDAYHIAPVFFGFGVPSYVDEKGIVTVNTPEAISAMQWLVSMSKVSLKEQTADICTADFKEGKVGMFWTGPWNIKTIEDAKIDYGIFPMGKPFVGIKTLMMSKNAVDRGNQDVVLDVMKYFTSADVQKKIAAVNKTIPAAAAALKDPAIAQLVSVVGFGDAASGGVPVSASPYAGAQWGPVGDAVKAIWSGAQAPDKALAAAQKLIEDAIAQMK
jgi:arabinogalactan oligomer/maltooligosaccharide transport system substrate-binding protein